MNMFTVEKTIDSPCGGDWRSKLVVLPARREIHGRCAEDSAEETSPTSHECSHHKEMVVSAYEYDFS